MGITVTKQGGSFQPHPETSAITRGVVVDVTPLKTVPDNFKGGNKQVFKIVIESEEEDENGKRFCVWSKLLTPSLNEKANLTKLLKQIRGKDLSAEEQKAFDLDNIIGLPVQMMVVHEEHEGQTYANLSHLQAHRGPNPLTPSGKYIRAQDREERQGSGAAYQRAAGAESARADWQTTKVHVGKNKGLPLGDLEREAVEKLITNWLPTAKAAEKPTADDRRLIAALEAAQAFLAQAGATEEQAF